MSKLIPAFAAGALACALMLPMPAGAAEQKASGLTKAGVENVAEFSDQRRRRRRVVVRRYYGPRYYAPRYGYYAPYPYYGYYRPYPYYGYPYAYAPAPAFGLGVWW
jgi:hypothetical protein